MRLGDPADPAPHIGPIANRPHFDRVLRDNEAAEAEDAVRVCGGKAVRFGAAPNGWFIAPTIFTRVTNAMALAGAEIFGPVLAVIPFDTENESIRLANDTDFGLPAGIWTRDAGRAVEIADRLRAGTVYINNYFNATTQPPVGKYKKSVYGRENGIEGMRAFQQTKSVWLATSPRQPNPFA